MTEDKRKQIRGVTSPSDAVTPGSDGSHCVLLFIEVVDEMSSLMMRRSQAGLDACEEVLTDTRRRSLAVKKREREDKKKKIQAPRFKY